MADYTRITDNVGRLFGVYLVAVGVNGHINPVSAAKAFGIPQANEQNVLCFPMACIRTAKIGLSILALSFQGQRKAAGTVLALVGLVAGPSDAWMCWENGGPQWKVHLMASALCGTVGWMMAR